MNNQKFEFATSTRIVFIFLMICTALKSFQIGIIDKVGAVGLYASSIFYIYLVLYMLANGYKIGNGYRVSNNKIIFIIDAFLLVLIFNNFNSHYLRGFINIFESIVALSIVFFWMQINFFEDKLLIDSIFKFLVVFLFINYLYLIPHFSSIGFYSSFYTNSDYFGELMGIYFFLTIIIYLKTGSTKFRNIGILYVPFVFSSGSRTWSAIIILNCLIFFIGTKIKRRITWNCILLFFYTIIVYFINIYIKALTTSTGQMINDLSIKYLHKQFFSGRNYIWETAINLVSQCPFLGFGTGALYGDYVADNRSIHSYFIQLLFQDGWLGLFLFVIITFIIWNALFCKNKVSIYCAACFFGFLLANFFEVAILQNQMNFVILYWMIISLGLSESKKYREGYLNE